MLRKLFRDWKEIAFMLCSLAFGMTAFGFIIGAKDKPPQQSAVQSVDKVPDTSKSIPTPAQFEQIIIAQKHRIDALTAELADAQKIRDEIQKRAADAAGQMALQCPQWNPALAPAQSSVSTVLYETSRASVNISLISLPGAPRIALGKSELAPRWVIPGRIQPAMLGETRQAIYYYFDPAASTWQGPFAPQRVTQ